MPGELTTGCCIQDSCKGPSFLIFLALHMRSSWDAVNWIKPCNAHMVSHVIVCGQDHTTQMLRIILAIFNITNLLQAIPHHVISPTPISPLPFLKECYLTHFVSAAVSGDIGLPLAPPSNLVTLKGPHHVMEEKSSQNI